MNKELKSKLLPISLAVLVVILDQITKILVMKNIPLYTIGAQFFGDFLRIIHVANTGVAFSVGATWSDTLRRLLFSLIPLIVIGIVVGIYFKNNTWTKVQRWAIMGIVGGGLGNLIDRFFRAEGVVDFIDVKFYGLFGLERWPTFNVADAAVVVCGIMLIVSFIITYIKESKEQKSQESENK
ncbi:signal peptidase II Aspartic peptidase. MEROPS family A08 [Treponema bryantii]|uniref:Lipoprotein signal peptidase n=1 Tax=Treponema bryantii TaxID=163 RepID=A0A1H9HIF1_9SPIR|nr:signal peptidase II [Treponema bryantii]SEQ62129.1 signal peptidase II Aspartic peptidase. MEROPS family A08 [Treponema bryantii]